MNEESKTNKTLAHSKSGPSPRSMKAVQRLVSSIENVPFPI